jgi:hypothetical protein
MYAATQQARRKNAGPCSFDVSFLSVPDYIPKFGQIGLAPPQTQWGTRARFAKSQQAETRVGWSEPFRALGNRRSLTEDIQEIRMKKTLTALVAAATLAGSLAATAPEAAAQGRGFLPGLIVGGIVGGAIVAATAPRGYVVYPGYSAPVNYPGCYWTRQPVYDAYGNIVGWRGRPFQVCP